MKVKVKFSYLDNKVNLHFYNNMYNIDNLFKHNKNNSIYDVFLNKDLREVIIYYTYNPNDIIFNGKYHIFYKRKDKEFIDKIDKNIIKLIENTNNIDLIKYVYKLKFDINIPEEWLKIYLKKNKINLNELGPFGNFSNWDFLNISELLVNEECYYDVAVKYAGMGHFYVFSILKNDNKCFFRMSGGANGWDRLINHQMFLNHDPYKENNLFNINDGIKKLNEEEIDLYLQKGDGTKINLNNSY